jgi:nitrite reductase/ring-hydroxylating ferredoxin subunit
VEVGQADEIPRNRCVPVAGGRAVVARAGDVVVAFENRCLHDDSPLAGGWVEHGVLTCPAHFWRYRLPSGERVGFPGEILVSYPVEVVEGRVVVDLPDPGPARSMREVLLEHARTWRRGDEP